jgi:hypothetical protein
MPHAAAGRLTRGAKSDKIIKAAITPEKTEQGLGWD